MPQPPEFPPKPPNSNTPNPGYPPPPPLIAAAPTVPNLWSADQQGAAYAGYEMGTQYVQDDGILQIPIAGEPGARAVLVRLHGGCMRKYVDVQTSRGGLVPSVPDLVPQNPANEARAGFVVAPQIPLLQADGTTYLYRVATGLTFFLQETVTPADQYRMGSAPTTTTSADVQKMDAGNFDGTIL